MELTPPYDNILEDETLAPLKRNHACLQCKKRKVKCDAVRPTCNPCMRSHAHALRSAQRNKSRPPPLVCTYADDDDCDDPSSAGMAATEHQPERKKTSSAASAVKRAAVGDRSLAREKERRTDEERETLKARIAELEARIAALATESTPPVEVEVDHFAQGVKHGSAYTDPPVGMNQTMNGTWTTPMSAFPVPMPQMDTEPSHKPPFVSIETGTPGNFQSFDFSNLLVLPASWPKNLPSPAILEHMVETFFQCEPSLPRLFHRATLLARIKLSPTSPDFPFPGLLHAICAAAEPHTAWTIRPPPDEAEANRIRYIKMGLDLEASEDFGLAQLEAAERCIRHSTVTCMMGTGPFIFDVVRTHMVLAMAYMNKGMALRSWMVSSVPPRLINALEISNRNKRDTGGTGKPPLMSESSCDREREERLATVWLAYASEVGFAVNSSWAHSFELSEIHVPLPTSTDEFHQKFDRSGFMKLNPQTPDDPDVLVNHPVADPFVLFVKSTFLLGKVSRWIRDWQQRIKKPNDEMEGITWPSFIQLNSEINAFHVPSTLKNLYRLADSGGNNLTTFNSDLMAIHVFPNLATLMLHEQFIDWEGPETPQHRALQKAFEAIVGFIHLIPSQLDVTLILTPVLAFSLFTVGRFVNKFILWANAHEEYAMAMRWKTDVMAISNMLGRYGTKHILGYQIGSFLVHYQRMYEEGHPDLACIEPARVAAVGNTPRSQSSATESPMETGSSIRSSAASVSAATGTAGHSLGQTPESVDAVDIQTHSYHACMGMQDSNNCAATNGAAMPDLGNLNGFAQTSMFTDDMMSQFANPEVAAMLNQPHDMKHPVPDSYFSDLLSSVQADANGNQWNTMFTN